MTLMRVIGGQEGVTSCRVDAAGVVRDVSSITPDSGPRRFAPVCSPG